MAEDDISNDFKQVRISRLTLGLIMTVASVSAVIVWNAAAVSNKINTLSTDIVQLQEDMEDIGEPTVVLSRLDSIERALEGIDVKGFETRLSTIETWAYVELTESQDKEVRYLKGKVISVGDKVPVLKKGDIVRYDKHAGHGIEHKDGLYYVIKVTDIVIVE